MRNLVLIYIFLSADAERVSRRRCFFPMKKQASSACGSVSESWGIRDSNPYPCGSVPKTDVSANSTNPPLSNANEL
jgi:hypothetical protein